MELPQLGSERDVRRIAIVSALVLALCGAVSWLLVHEMSATQRVADKVKPYDPLQ